MTDELSLPVSVPGGQEATRTMHDFRGAVEQSAQAAASHSSSQHELARSVQETGHHTESLSGKFKELGGELRHTAPEVGRFLREMVSQFAPVIAGIEGIKTAYEFVGDTIREVTRDSIREMNDLREAMERAHEQIGEATNKRAEKGADFIKKNGPTIGGIIASGGNAGLVLSATLSQQTGIDVERVNKAVLRGQQSGMTEREIIDSVRASALVEFTGHGNFDQASESAASLSKFSKHNARHPEDNVSLLTGTPSEVASRLINAKAVEKWASPEAIAARNEQTGPGQTRIYQEKDAWRREISALQEAGRFDEANALQAEGFQNTRGRFGGNFNPNIDAGGAPGTSATQLRVEALRLRRNPIWDTINGVNRNNAEDSLSDQRNGLENGQIGAALRRTRSDIEEKNPGMVSLVEKMQQDQAEWNRLSRQDVNQERAYSQFLANHPISEDPLSLLPRTWLGFQKGADPKTAEAAQKYNTDREAIRASFPNLSASDLNAAVKALISIDAKMGKISEGAAPK